MASLVFLTGGCRSGKSDLAVQLAEQHGGTVAMLVPCIPADDEMKERIALHRSRRPANWPVYEEAVDPGLLLGRLQEDVIVFDCLPTWIGNLLVRPESPDSIEMRIPALLEACLASPAQIVIVVSTEVGLGLVPDYPLGRQFRDLVGLANQDFVKRATDAYFLISGIPLNLKQLAPLTLPGLDEKTKTSVR